MSILKAIIKSRAGNLHRHVAVTSAAPGNNPPVWDQQPSPLFVNGTSANYGLSGLASDPDMDAITITINSASASMPTGVSWNSSAEEFRYDGAGAEASETGHVANASDGTDSTNSNSFNIAISSAVVSIGFPRLNIHHIGGRSESTQWTDSAWHDKLAVANQVQVNFAPTDAGHAAQAMSDIKAINPNIRLSNYSNWNAFLVSSAAQVVRRDYIVDNFVTPANGGTATDGMARQPDGTVISDWPNKEDLNPTDFPDLFGGQLPVEWNANEVYNLFYSGSLATTFDDIYFDIWRWFGRYPDRQADYGRTSVKYKDEFAGTGAADYENFDPTATNNSAIIRGKEAISAIVQTNAASDRGTTIELLGNIGSWSDWFDGGAAQNDVLLSAPAEMLAVTNGGMIENWGKINGFNPDGTTRNGSFERAYKDVQRLTEWMGTSSVTNTKRVFVHAELVSTEYDLAAYMLGVATLAGAYYGWAMKSDHRDPGELDEFFGQTASALSVAQKVAAMNWLGAASIAHPTYGQGFSTGVNGGLVSDGVYGMVFENGLLYVNPAGNGNKVISAPTGTWKHITGDQRAVNDGSNVSGTLSIDAATAIFLEPQ